MLFEKFLKVYSLPQGTEFLQTELEELLVEKLGNLQYNKCSNWVAEKRPIRYIAEINIKNSVYTLYSGICNSIKEALLSLFVKYGEEPEENSERYYTDNYYKEFHDIINKVYREVRS